MKTQLNAREQEIKTGWAIVTGILGFILFLGLMRLLLPLMFGLAPSLRSVFGFALNLGFCWLVYQGRGWARFLLVALLLVSATITLLGAAGMGGGFGAFLLIIGLLYLVGGVSLFAVPAVNRYFEYVNS